MKIWSGYGSEHSYNLILVGYFIDETKARTAEQKFERLSKAAESELPEVNWDEDQRFTTGVYELLTELKLWGLSRSDIENFGYDHTITRSGKELRIATDEGEVQGFLKVLIDGGARIEIFSAHDYTEDGKPRSVDGSAESQAAEEG
jgi:hypothetical protein